MLRLRPLPLTGDLQSVAFEHKSRNTDIDSQITRIPYIRVHIYSAECRIAFVYTSRFYLNQCHSHTHNGFNFSVACVLKTKTKISHTFAHADGKAFIWSKCSNCLERTVIYIMFASVYISQTHGQQLCSLQLKIVVSTYLLLFNKYIYIHGWHYIFLSKYDFMQTIWKYSFFSVSSQAIFFYFYFNRIMCVERHDAMRKIWDFIFFPHFKEPEVFAWA